MGLGLAAPRQRRPGQPGGDSALLRDLGWDEDLEEGAPHLALFEVGRAAAWIGHPRTPWLIQRATQRPHRRGSLKNAGGCG